MGPVTISQSELDRLQGDSDFLAALKAAGVDNWSGYDAAIEILNGQEQ